MNSTLRSRLPSLAVLALAFAVFFWFAGDGLSAYFTPDDMMNIYGAWDHPVTADRPVGTLFYNLAFRFFGLDPLGYRIGCFALLAGNLVLLYLFCLRLTASREVAALACLAGAYHAHLADLYYSTGTVYDLLCYTFWYGTFVWYTGIRESGRVPGWGQVALLTAMYAAAVNSKEIGVTLPAFVVLYEWLYRPKPAGQGRWRFAIVTIPLTAAFLAWKIAGPGRMVENPAYALNISLQVFTENWGRYLYDLFYGRLTFTAGAVAIAWTALLAVAIASRRRAMLFAWALMFFGALPVAFIAQRGIYVLYVTLPGWYLYTATLLDLLPRRIPWRYAAIVLVTAAVLIPLHHFQKPRGKEWVEPAFESIRGLRRELAQHYPTMPRQARILFTTDPYPEDDWIVTFIFRLHYRDREMQVDRIKRPPNRIDPLETYQYIFAFENGKLVAQRRL